MGYAAKLGGKGSGGGGDFTFIFKNGRPNPDNLSSLIMNDFYQGTVSILDYDTVPANVKITKYTQITNYDNNNSGYNTTV